MPVRNGERLLCESVRHVLAQDYPGELELVLAVGPSKDKTAELANRLAGQDQRITVVPNPSGQIPSALNAAVRASRHQLIIRADVRSRLPASYVATAVRTLAQTGAVNVGGVRAARGVTHFEQGVAWAMTSPAGLGTSPYNTGGPAGPSESVYLGAFRRAAIEDVGGYDERYLGAEDWQLNHRIRAAGGLIWFQPEMRAGYRPGGSIREISSQYFLYGRWRRVIMRRYGPVNLRFLSPAAVLLALTAGMLAGLAGLALVAEAAGGWWPWLLTAGLGVPLAYLIALAVVAARAGTDGTLSGRSLTWLPLVLAAMHLCWGAGFLTSPRHLGDPARQARLRRPRGAQPRRSAGREET